MRAWIPACLGLAALSLLVHSAPSYDPWAWIIWGREIVQLDLDTTDGPSWKPLPVLFTTVFALFGDAAPALWLVVARAGALLGLVLAYRVAARLGGRVAGVVAVGGLALSFGYLRYLRHGASEGLLVALMLWAVERHGVGRHDQAAVLGFLAALLRPEVWPFLGLYGLWLWVRERRLRPLLAGGAVLVPLLWFGPELVGSGEALRASSRALNPEANSLAFSEQPALAVLARSLRMVSAPVVLAAAMASVLGLIALATRRGGGTVVALAFGAIGWAALVAVMTEVGYAGNPRYLVPAAALVSVLGGVGVAWLGDHAARLGRRVGAGSRGTAAARTAALVLCLALAAPWLLPRTGQAGGQMAALRAESDRYARLESLVQSAGGSRRLTECGHLSTGLYQVPALAWALGVHVGDVDETPRAPGVVFRAFPDDGGPPQPPMPSGAAAFRRLARAPGWEVLAACPPGERAARRRPRSDPL